MNEAGDEAVREVRVPLEPDLAAAGLARRVSARTLLRWKLPSLVDDVVLAVSELVTNAVRYGRSPIWLTMRVRPRDVRVEVHDAEPAMKQSRAGEELAESGRGLDIVRSVATSTGVDEVPHDGKDVYATFDLPSGEERH